MRSSKALVVIWLLASAATAQDQAPTQDAVASQHVNRANLALTGGNVIADMTLTGTARWIAGSSDESGTAILKIRGRGDSRLELNLPSSQRVEVRSHDANGPIGAWKDGEGKSGDEARHNAWTEPAWFFPVPLLASLSTPNTAAEYLGAGEKGEHLKITRSAAEASAEWQGITRKLSATEVYLNPTTALPEAVTFNIHPDDDYGTDIPIEVRFSDYRDVNGIRVPFSIQRYLNNGLVLDISIENVVVNSGLPDSDFTL